MIIGLALIGFIYGLWFSSHYAMVRGGVSNSWTFGSIVGWAIVGGIAGWVLQNISRTFSKRDILRSMCTALGFLYGVSLHREAMLEYHSFTIGPIIGWSIVGNFVGYIVHGVFGKDPEEEITAPANPIQNHNPEPQSPIPQLPAGPAPDKDSCLSCNNSHVRLWNNEYRCWSCGYVLTDIPEPELKPAPPTLEEQDSTAEATPPGFEPEAFIVGNPAGTELVYTRNNGNRGVIYFDPDSIEFTDSHVTLQATGTTDRFSILRERILNPDVLSAPLITEEEEELPPIIEPTRRIVGDPSGQKLIYTRNNGEEGLIFFEPNSLEITAERIIVSPYHTEEEYAIERVRIKNLQELIAPTQTEFPLPLPALPEPTPVALEPIAPIVQWKPGTRIIIEELPIDTYEATQIMRRLNPDLNPFEVLEAVQFKPERDQLLQGYNPAIAEDIKTDFEAAGCTVSLKIIEDREVEADEVAPITSTQTETLEPEPISIRPPTEEEFHEIRMGTDRHRVFDLINSGELNLKAKDKHGYPILHGCQRASITSLLIEQGVDVMACDDSGNSALHNCDDSSVMEVLIGAELPVDAMNKNWETALHKWVFRGRLAPVKTLIHFGANPIHPNADGETPLEMAWQGLAKYDDGEHEQIIDLLKKQTL